MRKRLGLGESGSDENGSGSQEDFDKEGLGSNPSIPAETLEPLTSVWNEYQLAFQ